MASSIPHSSTDPSAPWRVRERDPRQYEALLRELEREAFMYAHILNQARDRDVPVCDLLADAVRLAYPHADEESVQRTVARCEQENALWREGLDAEGNPRWISLTVRERRTQDDSIAPEGVLPTEDESAAPKEGVLSPARDGKEAPIPERNNMLFDGLEWLVRGILGTRKKPPSPLPHDGLRPRRGTLPPPRPQPLRGLLRMLLAGAILGAAYHFLALRGWVPKLF